MRCSLTALGLFGLASAAPAACPSNHNLSTSKGLKLRVKLQDPAKDLPASPVGGEYVTSIHDGAGTNLVGFKRDAGRVFYVNGTGSAADDDDGRFWSTVSDGGTPAAPYGLALHALDDDPDVQVARLDVGLGDRGIYVPAEDAGGRGPQLLPTGWLACDEPLAYYGGKHFSVLRRSASGRAPPKECVLVVLLPECAELDDLPDGALASHEFAQEVSCYKDASKV
ncbi:hypothetical protein LMH87_002501 [Akanthomyces muscarius]|uniref:DUF7907 domain-containing protein n=1 Tax=Akanthomyces muscarius TaxID=2231603 RepID=A0A9W8UJA9_AKAMU|nr:hypothetical protein LMH87_002501 [Akanthomyces muscarius]KAJ4148012.1 hypothetical protein LMH87_002501 [Akanthomyces muscarius]